MKKVKTMTREQYKEELDKINKIHGRGMKQRVFEKIIEMKKNRLRYRFEGKELLDLRTGKWVVEDI